MSKEKQVMAMGIEGEDDENDDQNLGDGGRKRKSRSPDQDSPKRLKIQQDLNFSPNQEEEDSSKRLQMEQDLNRSPKQEEDSPKRLQIQQDLNHSPNQEEAPNPNPESDFLFEKELTARDINQWRVYISGAAHQERVLKALRDDEVEKAREKDGLSVATTDADGVEYKLILELKQSGYMILSHELHMLFDKYNLKVGDSVQGFASRRDAAGDHFRLRLQFLTK